MTKYASDEMPPCSKCEQVKRLAVCKCDTLRNMKFICHTMYVLFMPYTPHTRRHIWFAPA